MTSTTGEGPGEQPGEQRHEVERILDASAAPRATAHFVVLNLPLPSIDALGRPAWSTPATDVSKAYRNLSRVVHPDKIHDPDLKEKARDAFEAVKAAYAALSNEDTLEEVLREYAAVAKERGDLEDRHNDKTLDQKMDAMGKELDERKRLREEEYVSMTDEIRRQLEEKRRRALLVKKKREEKDQQADDGWSGGIDGIDGEGRRGDKAAGNDHEKNKHDEDDEDKARRRRRQQKRRRDRRR